MTNYYVAQLDIARMNRKSMETSETRVARSVRLSALAALLAGSVAGLGAQQPPLDRVNLPEGFSIDVYASGLENPRSMVLSPNGTLFVGSRITPREIAQGAPPDAGQVYAVLDRDGDQRADEVITLTQGLNAPNGVAFRDGALYVAEISRILRYDDIETRLDDPPAPVVVNDSFPTDWMHGWKFIDFGPDGKLYTPVGAPCNICDREADDPRYASITRMNADGSNLEVFASGIRNSVGYDWHPETGELWFTSNGRDSLGDERPGDTLNHAPRPGLHFGFPYCHAGDIPDPEFGSARPPDRGASGGRPVDVLVMPDGALLVSDDRMGVIYRISYAKPSGP